MHRRTRMSVRVAFHPAPGEVLVDQSPDRFHRADRAGILAGHLGFGPGEGLGKRVPLIGSEASFRNNRLRWWRRIDRDHRRLSGSLRMRRITSSSLASPTERSPEGNAAENQVHPCRRSLAGDSQTRSPVSPLFRPVPRHGRCDQSEFRAGAGCAFSGEDSEFRLLLFFDRLEFRQHVRRVGNPARFGGTSWPPPSSSGCGSEWPIPAPRLVPLNSGCGLSVICSRIASLTSSCPVPDIL